MLCAYCLQHRESPCVKFKNTETEEIFKALTDDQRSDLVNRGYVVAEKMGLGDAYYTGTTRIPVFLSMINGGQLRETPRFQEFLAWKEAKAAFQELMTREVAYKPSQTKVESNGWLPLEVQHVQQQVVKERVWEA